METSVARQDGIGGTLVSAEALLEIIRQLAAEVHSGRATASPSLDNRLEQDYGFDSLGRVELFLRIERRFGVGLPEAIMAGAETPLAYSENLYAFRQHIDLVRQRAQASIRGPSRVATLAPQQLK